MTKHGEKFTDAGQTLAQVCGIKAGRLSISVVSLNKDHESYCKCNTTCASWLWHTPNNVTKDVSNALNKGNSYILKN